MHSVADCRRGYRTVDGDVLQSLRSRYARLLFIYLSGNSDSFTFNEETVRGMFGIKERYKGRISAIKSRLDCVKREFEEIGVYFHWEFRGRNGKSISLHVQAKGMSQYHPSLQEGKGRQPQAKELSGALVSFLKEKVKLDDKGIACNKRTFLQYIYFYGEEGLTAFLRRKMKEPGYHCKRNRTGWLIGAVKSETAMETATGRVEGKKAGIDNMPAEIMDPRIREASGRLVKKFDSS